MIDDPWIVMCINRQEVSYNYLREMVEAAQEALKDNRITAEDRIRLASAERVGPGNVGCCTQT